MSPHKVKEKKIKALRNRKLKPFKALLIKNKKFDLFWTTQFFASEEKAFRYWQDYCARHNIDCNWEDFEVVMVSVAPTKRNN